MQIDLDLPPDILRNPGSNYLPRKSKKRAPEKDQCNVEFSQICFARNVILHTRVALPSMCLSVHTLCTTHVRSRKLHDKTNTNFSSNTSKLIRNK